MSDSKDQPQLPSLDDIVRASGLENLGDDPPSEAIEVALRRLGELAEGSDAVRVEALRARAVQAIKPHGWRTSAVDAVLGSITGEPEESGESPLAKTLRDPEPWPTPVDGRILDELEGVFNAYLSLPPGASVALALWVTHAHAHAASCVSPILAVLSPVPRCGKSTLMELLSALVPRPLLASNVTPAALFRGIERFHPTVLIDEADTFLYGRDELRGILNAGHTKSVAYVLRTVGDNHEPRTFRVWAPKAIAMIGRLPATLMDRSVVVSMQRKPPGVSVKRLHRHRLELFESLRRRIWTWAQANLEAIQEADREPPRELNDRMADNWRVLIAIAAVAGAEWPRRAREAALLQHDSTRLEEDDHKTQILRDLRDLFRTRPDADRLPTDEIVTWLHRLDESPWSEFGRGNGAITAVQVARLLKPFDVRPRQFKHDGKKVRGYLLGELEPVFQRYLPPEPPTDPVPPVPPKESAAFAAKVSRYSLPQSTGWDHRGYPPGDSKVPGVPGLALPTEMRDAPYEQQERWAIQNEPRLSLEEGL